jgi:hypothetical protein
MVVQKHRIKYKKEYQSKNGYIYALSAAAFIIVPFLVFTVYDYKTSYRQNQILSSAKHSAAIVASLFPATIAEKLYATTLPIMDEEDDTTVHLLSNPTNSLRQGDLGRRHSSIGNGSERMATTRHLTNLFQPFHPNEPLAEFYPETTVIFAGKYFYKFLSDINQY